MVAKKTPAPKPAAPAPARKTAAKAPAKIARRPVSQTTEVADTAEVVEHTHAPVIRLEEEHAAAQPQKPIDDEMITVIVPKQYTLSHGAEKTVYEAGTQEMLKSHAEHWYSRAQGVKIYRK